MLNGKGITKEEIEENPGDFVAVQSGEENNGVLGKIDKSYCIKMKYTYTEKPCLTVARTGSAGYVAFQESGCVVGDSAKILLLEDDIATTNIYLFLQTILTAQRFKYAYGRKVTENKYMNDVIKLPIKIDTNGKAVIDETIKYSDKGLVPDWQFMEDYIKSLKSKPITTSNNSTTNICIENWKEFKFGKLISKPYKAKAYNKDDLTISTDENDMIRYITRTAEDNGCELLVSLNDVNSSDIEKPNAITIGDTTATCFYQDEQFIAGDHMVVVRADWLNKYNALFILSILKQEQFKYSYGRAFLMERIENTILKLPILLNEDYSPFIDSSHKYSDNGFVPDWQFMENYIKLLPYGDRI